MKKITRHLLALSAVLLLNAGQSPASARPATAVLDDSAFYGEMPKGDIITQAGAQSPREAAQPEGVTPPASNQSPP